MFTLICTKPEHSQLILECLKAINPDPAYWCGQLETTRETWSNWEHAKSKISLKLRIRIEGVLRDSSLWDEFAQAATARGIQNDLLVPIDQPIIIEGDSGPINTPRDKSEHVTTPEEALAESQLISAVEAPMSPTSSATPDGAQQVEEVEEVEEADILDVLPGGHLRLADSASDTPDEDSSTKKKVFSWSRSARQELFLPIHKFIWLYPAEEQVVATPAFQRLRKLNQLGMSYIAFPGATHRRFEHVLGTVHLTDKIIRAINYSCDKPDPLNNTLWNKVRTKLNPREVAFTRLAALLHDIGHLPFGHTVEDELKALKGKHDESARLHTVLTKTKWSAVDDLDFLDESHRKRIGQSLEDIINEEYGPLMHDQSGLADADSLQQELSCTFTLQDPNGSNLKEVRIKASRAALLLALKHRESNKAFDELEPFLTILGSKGEETSPKSLDESQTEYIVERLRTHAEAWDSLRLRSLLTLDLKVDDNSLTFLVTPSQLVQLIILKPGQLPVEVDVTPEVEFKQADREIVAQAIELALEKQGFRLGVCRDIVGNTICADLLDYLHRDWYHTGRLKEPDERIFQYVELRIPQGPGQRAQTKLVLTLDSPSGPRSDGISVILDLLESRYQLAETVLFHKTKLKATAMLERSLSLALQPRALLSTSQLETQLTDFLLNHAEEEIVPLLSRGEFCKTLVQGASKAAESLCEKDAYLLASRRIAYCLDQRQLYKQLFTRFALDLSTGYSQKFAEDYYASHQEAGLNRYRLLNLLEEDFCLPIGTLAVYCPPGKMNAKLAMVQVLAQGEVKPFHEHEESLLNHLSGGHLAAQLQRFRFLWRFAFYIDEAMVRRVVKEAVRKWNKRPVTWVNDQEEADGESNMANKRIPVDEQEAYSLLCQCLEDATMPIVFGIKGRRASLEDAYEAALRKFHSTGWTESMRSSKHTHSNDNVADQGKAAKASADQASPDFPSGVKRRPEQWLP